MAKRLSLVARLLVGFSLLAALVPLLAGEAGAVLVAPTLVAPSDGATVDVNPTFQWQAVPEAAKYRVQIATSVAFTNPVTYDSTTYNTQATPPTNLPQNTLYWRVQALDSNNVAGPWSVIQSFTKVAGAGPVLDTPLDGAVLTFPDDPIVFTWQPPTPANPNGTAAPGPKQYEIEIDDDPLFTPPLYASGTTNNTSYALTLPQTAGQVWYWHVRSVYTDGQRSQFSASRTYTISWPYTPTLLSPADVASPTTELLTFAWTPVPGAASYQIQLSPDIDFSGSVPVDTTLKATKYTAPSSLPFGSYYWRVRAINNNGGLGGWSTTWSFVRSWPAFGGSPQPYTTVTLLSPTFGQTGVNDATFTWTPVMRASSYRLQIGTAPDLSGTVQTCTTNHTTVTPYSGCNLNLVPGTIYYWQVQPIDGATPVNGAYSSTFWFAYAGPVGSGGAASGEVIMLSPSSGGSVSVPVLSWSAVPNAGSYRVTVKQGLATVTSVTTVNTSWVPQNLVAGNSYSWYVQFYDANNNLSPVPTAWTFSYTAPVTAADPAPFAASGAAPLPQRMPLLTWTPVTGATAYQLHWAPVGSSTWTSLGTSTVAAYAHTALFASGTVQVRLSVNNVPGPIILVTVPSLGTPSVVTPDMSCVPNCGVLYDMPTFEWTAVPGASYYAVTIARDVQFTNVVSTYTVTGRTKFTPINSIFDGQAGPFYWYARPCTQTSCGPAGGSYAGSPSSPVGTFTKQSRGVEPIAPGVPDGSGLPIPEVPDQVTFSWRDFLLTNLDGTPATTEAERDYQVQVSTLADFSVVYDTSPNLDETTYTPANKTFPEGPLYWRVRAIDGSNNTLTWSPVWRLNKKSTAPTLLTPAPGATVSEVPAFTWQSQDYAVTYDIEVYKNPDQPLAVANRVLTQTTSMAAATFTTSLTPGTYGWRIRRKDAGGNAGPWTAQTNAELRLFTVQAAAPTLLSPVNDARVPTTMLFQWTSVPVAPQWRIQVSTKADFSVLLENQTTVMNTWAPTIAYNTDADYWWRVSTLNASGTVVATSSAFHFGRLLPTAPINVVAVAGNASAQLSWSPPADNGGSPVTGYIVTVSPGGATLNVSNATSTSVGGLTNGVTYTFTVAAINGKGTGPASAPSNAVMPSSAPDAPTDVVATAGDGSATVSWTPPLIDGGNPITGYTITVYPGGTTVDVGNVTSTLVSGLTNGVTYQFSVSAVSAAGTGSPSALSNSVTPQSAATAPSNVNATPGNTSVNLTWNAPVDNGGSPITGYVITVTPGGATVNVGNVTATTVTGLTNGTSYTFTVAAVNGVGTGPASAPSNAVTPRTTPGAPSSVTASPGNGSAGLVWSPPVSNGGSPITGYVITVSPGGTVVNVSNVTATTVTGLTNGTSYTFTVTAVNAAGSGPTSAPSNAVVPRTTPGSPTGVAAVAGDSSAQVSWVAPSVTGGSPVTGYVITVSPGGASVNVGNVTSTIVPSLTNGISYTFTVQAVNAAGAGTPSAPSNAVTPIALPGAPTNVAATAGKSSATVTWTAPLSAPAITGYTVTAIPGGQICSWTSGPLTCTVINLTAGTSYTFTVAAISNAGTGPSSSPSNAVVPWDGSGFHAVTPFRILDSRPGGSNTGFAGPIGANSSLSLNVAGVNGIPATAKGVVMNVTATGGTSASYLTVYPAGGAAPTTANLLFSPGQTVPNLVTVGIGAGGQVSFYNQQGSVHVIADVVGYYDDGTGPGDLFRATTPTRLLDSRASGPAPWTGAPLGANQIRDVTVRGAAGVPNTATAVVMNVTATGGTAPSYLQAFPSGAAQPVTANLLFDAGQTVPNLVTVGIGANGKVSLYNQQGSVHVIADVVGYFDPTAGGGRFHAINPSRLLDSRAAGPVPWIGSPLGTNQARSLTVGGTPAIPATATGLVANMTATGGSSASYLAVSPKPGPVPAPTANLLFAASQTVPNAVVVGLGTGKAIDIYNQLGSVHVILDAAGYYALT